MTTIDTIDGHGGHTGISGTPAWEEDFSLDPTGNWDNYKQKTAGSTTLSLNPQANHSRALATMPTCAAF